jgi:hypothetical protein
MLPVLLALYTVLAVLPLADAVDANSSSNGMDIHVLFIMISSVKMVVYYLFVAYFLLACHDWIIVIFKVGHM